MPKRWTVYSLAQELGVDRNALTRRLQGLEPETSTLRSNGAAVRHYRLSDVFEHLLGSQQGTDDPEKMLPKDRLDWYRGTREKNRHMAEAGQLIPAADYEREMSRVLKVLAVGLETLPDMLERDAGIDGKAVEVCQRVVDRFRDELAGALAGE